MTIDTTNMCSHLQRKLFDANGEYRAIREQIERDPELTALDIVIYIASVVGAVLLANRWRKSDFVRRYWPLWIVVTILGIITIGVLTYHAPDWIIFADLG